MPSPFVKQLSKETGVSINKIEQLWDKAKEITADTFGVKEEDFGDREYAYTTGIVKKMLGLSEDSWKPVDFLKSEKSAREFIEEVVSSNFNIGNVTISKNSKKKIITQNITDKNKSKPSKKTTDSDNDMDMFLGLDGVKIKDNKQKEETKKKEIDDEEWIDKLIGLDGFKIIEEKENVDFYLGRYKDKIIKILHEKNNRYLVDIYNDKNVYQLGEIVSNIEEMQKFLIENNINIQEIEWDNLKSKKI